MKYLFYDLECASQRDGTSKICEFGYVITNEKFEVIERKNFIIDPCLTKYQWDTRVLRRILKKDRSYYEGNPNFKSYYYKIRRLFNECDYILGHSIDGDAKSLNDECLRYDLPSIDHEFYDIKKFYKEFANTTREVSVTNILEALSIQGEDNIHDAECDSYNTMLELKEMLDILEISLEDMIELCPLVKNENKNYVVESIERNRQKKLLYLNQNLNGDGTNNIVAHGINRRRVLDFIKYSLKPQPLDDKFKGKKFSISLNYERNHFKEVLNIIKIIYEHNGRFDFKASATNVFVRYDVVDENGNLAECAKLNHVNYANSTGANIQIIDFATFMNMLGTSKKELEEMEMPSFEFLKKEVNEMKLESISTSLGDIFKEFDYVIGD